MVKKHKFNAVKQIFNGRKYDSKMEARYAQYLERLKLNGEVLFYLEQVPFRLPAKIVLRLDFIEFHAPKDGEESGDIIFTEIKGMMTRDALIKIKQVEEIYNIKINLIRKF